MKRLVHGVLTDTTGWSAEKLAIFGLIDAETYLKMSEGVPAKKPPKPPTRIIKIHMKVLPRYSDPSS